MKQHSLLLTCPIDFVIEAPQLIAGIMEAAHVNERWLPLSVWVFCAVADASVADKFLVLNSEIGHACLHYRSSMQRGYSGDTITQSA